MEFINDLIVSILMLAIPLLLFVGVPLFIFVTRRRELARMTPAQRGVQSAEELRWHDEMMDPTNLSGWTNPDSGAYAGRRNDD
jgi:hypothetical protein